ncbi:hypothetical protein ACFLUF_00985 [Chloroflexota bacterium]
MIQATELARKKLIVVISRKAMLITAIPIVVLSVISVVGNIWTAAFTYSYALAQLLFIFTLLLSVALCLIWFVLAIILTIIERMNPRTVGIWVGVGIGIVSLTISVGLTPDLM